MTPRCILITGAGSGIGAGIATELARAGHHLVVTDVNRAAARSVADDILAHGGSAEAQVLDVTSDGCRDATPPSSGVQLGNAQ